MNFQVIITAYIFLHTNSEFQIFMIFFWSFLFNLGAKSKGHSFFSLIGQKIVKSRNSELVKPLVKVQIIWEANENFLLNNLCKVHIFWEGHKFLRNLQRWFVLCSNGQIYGGDFAKFCGLLRIYVWTLRTKCSQSEVSNAHGQIGILKSSQCKLS